jgi:hypothetical protein
MIFLYTFNSKKLKIKKIKYLIYIKKIFKLFNNKNYNKPKYIIK